MALGAAGQHGPPSPEVVSGRPLADFEFCLLAADALWLGRAEPCGDPLEADAQAAAHKAIAAVLQLFDLCPSQGNLMIRRADLDNVLRDHLGQTEAASGVQRLFSAAEQSDSCGLLDFLSYWHGMDQFLAEAGAWSAPPKVTGKTDALGGMRVFRDGVLNLWRCYEPEGEIPAHKLLDLLAEVQAGAEEPQFWGEVMRTVPHQGGRGVPLHALARAVCAWLRHHAGQRQPVPALRRSAPETPPRTPPRGAGRRRSVSAHARLGLSSEATPSSPSTSHWTASPVPPATGQRGSTLFLDAVNTPAVEMQRALEFVDFLGQQLESGSHEQQAQQQLLTSLGSLSRTLHRQDMEISSLKHSNVVLGKKREVLEAELAAAREFQEDVRELQEERDGERRRAEALEHQIVALRHECLHSSQELERLKASTEDSDRQRAVSERRDWQWRDRCGQLEQAADTAEGQARWMREEIDRLKGELSSTREERESLTSEIERLKKLLEAATDSIRSHTANATESDECIKELRRQLNAASGAAGGSAPDCGKAAVAVARAAKQEEEAEPQDNVQQTQLDLLRSMRDELLRLDDSWAEVQENEDTPDSPRHVQVQRRCRFLELQVQALLRHTQAVERLLDAQRDAQLGPSPDVRRRLSIQRVHQEGEALFNELSERLHTLEVQKADADQEVQRLQAGASELRRELDASQQSREELLLELRVARHDSTHSVRDELRACLKEEDLYLGGEPSTTSETRSVSSSGYARGGDSSGFLTEAYGTVHPSPKGAFQAGVNKVMSARFLAGAGDRSTRSANSGAGERPRRSQRRKGEEEGVRRAERAQQGKKKGEGGDCEMQ